MMFSDRADAGRQLAERLDFLRGTGDLLVLGIPRGGIVVAYEVAEALEAPLDVWIAHKIGAPGNPEFAIGSVAAGGEVTLNTSLVNALGASPEFLAEEIERERAEMERRLRDYRGARPPALIENRTVLLIDDGLATGATARAALRSLKELHPRRLFLAVPVGASSSIVSIEREAYQIVALVAPVDFRAVGEFYENFGQTTDAEVVELLRKRESHLPSGQN